MLEKYKQELKGKGKVYLRIKVHPNAPLTLVKEIMADDTVKIDVAAAPEKGRANQALINFLGNEFGAKKSNVKIISGAGEKLKLIRISHDE